MPARCRTFCRETAAVRAGDWRIAPVPEDLLDRRVEITGPVDRKMVINALNAPVQAFMADFEDSARRPGSNIIRGQVNLRDAIRRTISFEDRGDRQGLPAERADRDAHRAAARLASAGEARAHQRRGRLRRAVRLRAVPRQQPRGAGAAAAPARTSTCRRWRAISRRGCGTTCSSPPRRRSDMPRGTIKATVLIETILAAFEMDEILYELREHSRGTQLRPLGLHLQLHQEVPQPRRTSCSRTAPPSPWTGTS